jgi:peptidoglycan/LPS O-acetylase OafA/YrhL
MVGADWAELYSYQTTVDGDSINRLIAIQPVWSLAVEITFYLASPFILRRSYVTQIIIFLAALLLRIGIWMATGGHWTIWLYYFAPATWVFFMAGVQAHHLMVYLEKGEWFARAALPIGRGLAILLVLLIAFYIQSGIFHFQDWRYYTVVGLSLPFLFSAFKRSAFDAALAAWSYPIYLAHWVIRAISPPFRHFVPEAGAIYVNLGLTLALSFVVLRIDRKIQHRFKHIV